VLQGVGRIVAAVNAGLPFSGGAVKDACSAFGRRRPAPRGPAL